MEHDWSAVAQQLVGLGGPLARRGWGCGRKRRCGRWGCNAAPLGIVASIAGAQAVAFAVTAWLRIASPAVAARIALVPTSLAGAIVWRRRGGTRRWRWARPPAAPLRILPAVARPEAQASIVALRRGADSAVAVLVAVVPTAVARPVVWPRRRGGRRRWRWRRPGTATPLRVVTGVARAHAQLLGCAAVRVADPAVAIGVAGVAAAVAWRLAAIQLLLRLSQGGSRHRGSARHQPEQTEHRHPTTPPPRTRAPRAAAPASSGAQRCSGRESHPAPASPRERARANARAPVVCIKFDSHRPEHTLPPPHRTCHATRAQFELRERGSGWSPLSRRRAALRRRPHRTHAQPEPPRGCARRLQLGASRRTQLANRTQPIRSSRGTGSAEAARSASVIWTQL